MATHPAARSAWTLRRDDGVAGEVAAPPWRFDIAIEEDLIEEVARIHGFDRIPETDASVHAVAMPAADGDTRSPRKLRRTCSCSAATSKRSPTASSIPRCSRAAVQASAALALSEPDRGRPGGHARLAVAGACASALVENQRRQQARVRLFEIGRRFQPGERRSASRIPVVAGLAAGPTLPEQWGAGHGCRRVLRRQG